MNIVVFGLCQFGSEHHECCCGYRDMFYDDVLVTCTVNVVDQASLAFLSYPFVSHPFLSTLFFVGGGGKARVMGLVAKWCFSVAVVTQPNGSGL